MISKVKRLVKKYYGLIALALVLLCLTGKLEPLKQKFRALAGGESGQ